MKFFWKIFFSTMFLSVFFFALGGYFLIQTSFKAALDQEIKAAYDIDEIVYYSLQNEFRDLKDFNSTGADFKEIIEKSARSININNMNEKINFNIIGSDFTDLFSSLENNFGKAILSSLKKNERGYSLQKNEEGVFIQVIRPVNLLGEECFIETERDVTSIFDNQSRQYKIFLKILTALLIIGSFLTMSISKIIMKPIKRLTSASQEIAAGDFRKKLKVTGGDEISILSEQFNVMSYELEKKIVALREEAEKKELFVGAFSHELKTPLTAIMGFSDRLRKKLKDDENLCICANYIFDESKRLESLSMQLLELVVLKKNDFKFKKVSASEFFNHIESLMKSVLNNYQINLITNIESSIILIEPALMETVCVNLIDNARKAIGTGGEIILTAKNTPLGYTFSIKDNGRGMEESEFEKISEAFYMVDRSRSRKEGGAGLGLAICDKILKLHGAKIEFSSKVGNGTCVTILLKGGSEYESI